MMASPSLFKVARVAACAIGLAAALGAQAAYPEKPINLIVAYAPGGGSDLTARAFATYVEKYLGNNARIVVQNKTGAGGAIGFSQLANAPADGYTIGMINTPNVLTIPIERKVDFTWQRFDLLGNLVDDPGNFAVHASSPVKTLKELSTRPGGRRNRSGPGCARPIDPRPSS